MSPSKQNGWLLRAQKTLGALDKVKRDLSKKKMKKRNLNLYSP